jgi:hypothetical protein
MALPKGVSPIELTSVLGLSETLCQQSSPRFKQGNFLLYIWRWRWPAIRAPAPGDLKTSAKYLGTALLRLVDPSPIIELFGDGDCPVGGEDHPLRQNLPDENGHSITPLLIFKPKTLASWGELLQVSGNNARYTKGYPKKVERATTGGVSRKR